jgi:hypothetical protein
MSTPPKLILNSDQPTIVEITLFRNNWKDNQIIHTFKKDCGLFNVTKNKDSFFVSVPDVVGSLSRFDNEIDKFNGMIDDTLSRNVNSLYFIQNILETFESLMYVKVNISDKKNYTRMVDDVLSFDIKIMHSKIIIRDWLNKKESEDLKSFFKKLDLIFDSPVFEQTYLQIRLQELLDRVETFRVLNNQPDTDSIIEKLFLSIDEKTESDNPSILLVF